jgi:hypothetical protein
MPFSPWLEMESIIDKLIWASIANYFDGMGNSHSAGQSKKKKAINWKFLMLKIEKSRSRSRSRFFSQFSHETLRLTLARFLCKVIWNPWAVGAQM